MFRHERGTTIVEFQKAPVFNNLNEYAVIHQIDVVKVFYAKVYGIEKES